LGEWVEPRITDLGGLTELTQSVDLFFGPSHGGVHDLSFSGVNGASGASGAGGPASGAGGAIGGTGTPTPGTTTPASSAPPSAGTGPASAGGIPAGTGATGAAQGQLPFTGYSATGIAALGSALSAAGIAVRRALRPGRR
jgi:hypothetical protein